VPLLDQIQELYGKTSLLQLVSVDARMSHKKNAAELARRGLWYLMALKKNQPESLRVAKRALEECRVCATSTDHHSGSEVVRQIQVASISGRLDEWAQATEVWKVEQVRTHKVTRMVHRETRYFITNIPRGKFSAQQKLEAVRRHWGSRIKCFGPSMHASRKIPAHSPPVHPNW
jgi:hypothetical protein